MDHMSISIFETDQAIIELFKGFGHFFRCHTNLVDNNVAVVGMT